MWRGFGQCPYIMVLSMQCCGHVTGTWSEVGEILSSYRYEDRFLNPRDCTKFPGTTPGLTIQGMSWMHYMPTELNKEATQDRERFSDEVSGEVSDRQRESGAELEISAPRVFILLLSAI